MQIKRAVNGKARTFRLTQEEIYAIFCKQEHEYFLEDLQETLKGENYSKKDISLILKDAEIVSEINCRYEGYQRFSGQWSENMSMAISECSDQIEALLNAGGKQ